MALFYPIVVDSTLEIVKELPAGDTLNLTNSTIRTKDLHIDGSVYQTINNAATTVYDLSLATYFQVSLSSNLTVTSFTNAQAAGVAQSFAIEITNNGAWSVGWPVGIKWDGGVAPTLAENRVSLFMFFSTDGGTTWRGQVVMETPL